MERWRRPTVMGVVNVTPDSFSDGGAYDSPEQAAEAARLMLAAGAAVVDVGGESTRPGAEPVSRDDELRRVAPGARAAAAAFRCPSTRRAQRSPAARSRSAPSWSTT